MHGFRPLPRLSCASRTSRRPRAGPDIALDPERFSEVSQIEIPQNADQLSSNPEFEAMPIGILDDSDVLGFGALRTPVDAPTTAPIMSAAIYPVDCLVGVRSHLET